MAERAVHRGASRLARKRLSKRLGTTTRLLNGRILPGHEKPMMLKDIMNTGARFNNRRRPEGWLTPSTAHLLRTHLSLNGKVCQILPVTRIAVELNRFAFMTMEDPAVRRGSTRKAHSMAAMESGRPWRISQAVSQPRHWT